MDATAAPLVFVVRLTSAGDDGLTGVVERVRTGEKRKIRHLAALGTVIAEMAARRGGVPEPLTPEEEEP